MISETSKKIDDVYIKNYFIKCNYNDICKTVIDVMNNYDYYFNKIFGDFNDQEIKDYYNIHYNIFIEDFNKQIAHTVA